MIAESPILWFTNQIVVFSAQLTVCRPRWAEMEDNILPPIAKAEILLIEASAAIDAEAQIQLQRHNKQ